MKVDLCDKYHRAIDLRLHTVEVSAAVLGVEFVRILLLVKLQERHVFVRCCVAKDAYSLHMLAKSGDELDQVIDRHMRRDGNDAHDGAPRRGQPHLHSSARACDKIGIRDVVLLIMNATE